MENSLKILFTEKRNGLELTLSKRIINEPDSVIVNGKIVAVQKGCQYIITVESMKTHLNKKASWFISYEEDEALKKDDCASLILTHTFLLLSNISDIDPKLELNEDGRIDISKYILPHR
jgi:hypothetical protein